MARTALQVSAYIAWVLWPAATFVAVLAATVNLKGDDLLVPLAIQGGVLLALLASNTLLVVHLRKQGVIRRVIALCICWIGAGLTQLIVIFIGANIVFSTLYIKPTPPAN